MRKILPPRRPVLNPITLEIPERKPLFGKLPRKGNANRKLVVVQFDGGPRPYHVTKGWRDGR